MPLDVIENRKPHRAGQRRSIPRVAEIELRGTFGQRVVNVLAAEDGRQRRVTGAKTFADGHDVWLERDLVRGEPAADAAHAGHDLVEAHDEAVLLAALGEPVPEAVGWGVGGQRGGADRLAEERRHRVRAGLFQRSVELFQRFLSGRIEARGRRRDMQVVRHVLGVRMLQRASPSAQRERAERRAVVRLRRRDHTPPPALAAIDVIGARETDCGLIGLRPARRELDPGHLGDQPDHAVGQFLLRPVGEVVVVEIRDLLGLSGRRLCDLAHSVAQARNHGATRGSVEDALAVGGFEPYSLAALDVWVGEVEESRKDTGLVSADSRLHSIPPLLPHAAPPDGGEDCAETLLAVGHVLFHHGFGCLWVSALDRFEQLPVLARYPLVPCIGLG